MSQTLTSNKVQAGTTEARWIRYSLIGTALVFMFLFLVLPLAAVFTEALRKGLDAYLEALKEPDAWSAIRLTLITAAVAVPLNLVFGVAAAWAIAKYEFKGKSLLTTLVDLPFSVSPVVASSIARATPIRRGRRVVPPNPGITPRFTSGCPNFAFSDA